MKYILAIDQGTTSTRAILFDKKGRRIRTSQREFSQICPISGWVLHNPLEIMETVYEVVKSVLNQEEITLDDIETIGVTNQRETTVMWDKTTGKPIYDAIVWQSRQSKEICDKLEDKKEFIYKKTGLLINPYFSASKIKWILDYTNKYEEAKQGNILFGTIDTWILWNLTGLHYTDHTNASRTMLFNINTLEWDAELLELFDIPKEILPKVKSSSEIYGNVKIKGIEGTTKISSLVGDQQASLFGQCAHSYGDVKNTYGTGCFMLMNTKENLVESNNGLLTTIAWDINGVTEYALEGSVFVGGSAVQWLRDGMRLIQKSKDVEEASRDQGSNGVYVVPAFVGLGTPYWDNDARGSVFGLTRSTTRENFINATVESIAYQSKDVMEVMKEDANLDINSLAVDGGASGNNYLMKFQSNILNCKIMRPKCLETTALGAAYLSGLAVGFWDNINDLIKLHKVEHIFMPDMKEEERNKLYKGWKKAVEATMVFKVE